VPPHVSQDHADAELMPDVPSEVYSRKGETMKVIFLDIDGVLNNQPWLAEQRSFKNFCPANVEMLNFIIRATGAKIVISSNWRMYPYDLPALFKAQGVIGEIVGYTPLPAQTHNGILCASLRGNEINAWLKESGPIERYIILDDGDDMGKLEIMLVQTNPARGLTLEDAKNAVSLLGACR
jgi:hypothetical protein